jgi:hypothetical protein
MTWQIDFSTAIFVLIQGAIAVGFAWLGVWLRERKWQILSWISVAIATIFGASAVLAILVNIFS